MSSPFNPFADLIEDEYSRYSWVLRTSFWQKIGGTFQILFGTYPNPFFRMQPHDEHVGLLEYGMLFLPVVAERNLYERALRGPGGYIGSFLMWLLACTLTPLIFIILTLPRLLIATALTILCSPLIGLLHWISEKKSALHKKNLEPLLRELNTNDLNGIRLKKFSIKKPAVSMQLTCNNQETTIELKFLEDIAISNRIWLALRQLNIGNINILLRKDLKPRNMTYRIEPSSTAHIIEKRISILPDKYSYYFYCYYKEEWTPPDSRPRLALNNLTAAIQAILQGIRTKTSYFYASAIPSEIIGHILKFVENDQHSSEDYQQEPGAETKGGYRYMLEKLVAHANSNQVSHDRYFNEWQEKQIADNREFNEKASLSKQSKSTVKVEEISTTEEMLDADACRSLIGSQARH